jgi:hypothetical protein
MRKKDPSMWAEAVIAMAFGTRTLGANESVLVVQADSPERLEAVAGWLIKRGLRLTENGRFADFALVHGDHGLSLECDWLTFIRNPDGGEVVFRPPCRYVEGLDDFVVESRDVDWIDQVGHGFMLNSSEEYDVWLDFSSGRTIVSLKDLAHH